MRPRDIAAIMTDLSARMTGNRLAYRELTADRGKEPCRLWTPARHTLPKGSSRGGRKAAVSGPRIGGAGPWRKTQSEQSGRRHGATLCHAEDRRIVKNIIPKKRYWSRIQQLNYLRRIMPVCICISECRRTCRNSRFAVTIFNWAHPVEDPVPATKCQLDQRHPVAIGQAFAHREYPCLLRIV